MNKLACLVLLALSGSAVAGDLGDYAPAANICGKFSTYQPSTGAAFALAGTPALSVYKDNSTTQSTTGVTLTASFDSVTGLNHYCVDTSADGTFYSAGSNFDVVITTGTVDSVSVVGSVVGSFTLNKTAALKPTTAGRSLDVSASGEAGIDWANVGSPTTTVALTNTTVDLVANAVDATAIATDAITAAKIAADAIGAAEIAADAGTEIGTANWATTTRQLTSSQTFNLTGSITGNLSGSVGSVTGAVGSVTGSVGSIATGGITEASYATTAGSFDALGIIDQGTAQAATSTTLQLRSAAAFADDEIIGSTCLITGGSAGVGQARTITDYVSSTDTATVATWTTTPTGTITYECFGTAASSSGSGATAAEVWAYGDRQLTAFDEDVTTIDINATPTGAATSVTGAVGSVTGNVGGNVTGSVGSVATGGITAASIATDAIGAAEIAADAGTELGTATWASTTRLLTAGTNIVLAKGTGVTGFNDPTTAAIADAVWDETQSGHVSAGTFGAYLDAPVSSGAGGGLDAAGVRAAIGLATANLDVQLSGIQSDTNDLQTQIGVAGAGLTAVDDATLSAIAALNNVSVAQIRDMVVEDMGGGVVHGCVDAVLLAFAAGDITTSGSTTTWRDPSNGEVRIVSTVTSNGNRTSVITCPTY